MVEGAFRIVDWVFVVLVLVRKLGIVFHKARLGTFVWVFLGLEY